METMGYPESRARHAEVLDSVDDDHGEAVNARAARDPAVVSLDDYESLGEAAYLLRSPANARGLRASIDELESGKGVERDLLE